MLRRYGVMVPGGSVLFLDPFLFPGFLSLVLGLLEQLPLASSSAWALPLLFFLLSVRSLPGAVSVTPPKKKWGLERSWHFDTTWSSPFQQNYEDISHTFRCTFKEYFWMVGWQKKKSKACRVASLPSLGHSQQPQPSTFLPSPFWSQRSSPKNASWQE